MIVKSKDISLGADPELFVTKGNKIVSAIGLIGGTKDSPVPVMRGGLQEDNVLAEINIDPCNDLENWLINLDLVTKQLKERLGIGYSVIAKPSHDFTPEELCKNIKALAFGCDPDYNAYTGEENPRPSAETTLRTAGGHVHVGYPGASFKTAAQVCKALDVVLGIPSVILDPDNRRRSMYGKAGAFRLKSYGVEYRSLSNFWMNSRELKTWVFNSSKDLMKALDISSKVFESVGEYEVQSIINKGDIISARSVVNSFNIDMPEAV